MKLKPNFHIRRFSPDELSIGINIILDTTDLGKGYMGGVTLYLDIVLWQISFDLSLYKN
jgi:hypothetical protein